MGKKAVVYYYNRLLLDYKQQGMHTSLSIHEYRQHCVK